MIFYVITEIRKKYEEAIYANVKPVLENLSGDICLMLHYEDLSQALIDRHEPWAIIHSGRGSDYHVDPVLDNAAYKNIILTTAVAQLGICGGHQIIGHYYGSRMDAIRKLREDDPDYNPDYNPGYFKEKGYYPLRVVKEDPLFEGFGQTFRVAESHYWEIKELSPDLEVIASNDNTAVQAFRDPNRCLYGVQFHPERHTAEYPDGRTLLLNFFKIARHNSTYANR